MMNDAKGVSRTAIAAVRDCADRMDDCATSLRASLPTAAMEAALRAQVLERISGLKDTAGRVTFELALLQTQLVEGTSSLAAVVDRLTQMDATMMEALAAMADVVDRLEGEAEREEKYEPAFVLVIEATGVLLQALEKAKAATGALQSAALQRLHAS